MDTKTLALLVIESLALLAFMYGMGVFLTKFKKDVTQRNFGLFCFAVAGWLASQGLLLYITNTSNARAYLIIVYTFANLTALSFAAFIASLTRTRSRYHVTVAYSWSGFIMGQCILLFVNPIVSVATDPNTGIVSPIYNYTTLPLFALYAVGAFVMSIVTILRSRTVTKRAKRRLVQVAVIYLLSILMAAYLVPNSEAMPVLRLLVINLLTISFMLFLGKEVVMDRFIDLRRSGWRSLLRIVVVFGSLVLCVMSIAWVYVVSPKYSGFGQFWSQFLGMFLAVGASLLVLAVVNRLVKKWLRRYESDVVGFNESMQDLQFDLGYSQLSEQFAHNVALFFKPSDILIVLETQQQSKMYAFHAGYSRRNSTFEPVSTSDPTVKKVIELLPSAAHGKVGMKLNAQHGLKGYNHVFDIHGKHLRGAVVISDKYDGVPFTQNELIILSSAVGQFDLLLENNSQFETIQRFNVQLKEEVDQATKELNKTYNRLKELDETKDEFISMASHQLRTPLTSIKGNVSMILDGDAGDITSLQRDLLTQAFVSSQRMVYLVADLLNVSRLKSGKFVIELRPTNLPEVVNTEVNQVSEVAKSRGLELKVETPKSFPTLMLDETKTRQVIMNFVDNAIYYTPNGGKIRVVFDETNDYADVRVIDSGIGVPKADQKKLFSKFYRSNNARKARPDGTGLGLFMAKKVIVAQGGKIIFESKEGKGSTFGFRFPKK